jgi:hypothetical protein
LLDVFFQFCPMLIFDITVSLSMPYKWKSHRFNLPSVLLTVALYTSCFCDMVCTYNYHFMSHIYCTLLFSVIVIFPFRALVVLYSYKNHIFWSTSANVCLCYSLQAI